MRTREQHWLVRFDTVSFTSWTRPASLFLGLHGARDSESELRHRRQAYGQIRD